MPRPSDCRRSAVTAASPMMMTTMTMTMMDEVGVGLRVTQQGQRWVDNEYREVVSTDWLEGLILKEEEESWEL
jgi:hypothetical protein